MATAYEVHPAANLFPIMEGAEFEAFKADIQEHGQQESIVLFDEKIIDGRNRYQACRDLGIDVKCSGLEDCEDPVAYVLSANLHRRHLSTSQRAMIAAKLTGLKSGQHGRAVSNDTACPLPIEKAAKLLSVSRPSVTRALKVLRNADRETIDMVKAGKLTVGNVANTKKPCKAKSKPVPVEKLEVAHRARFDADAKQPLATGHVQEVSQSETVVQVAATPPFPEAEPRSVSIVHQSPLDTAPIADLIDSLAKRSTPEDFVSCSAEALDRIWQNIAMALTLRTDDAKPTADVFAKECEEFEEQLATPVPPAPASADDLFPVERRDDGWHVVLPSGNTDGPYIAAKLAREAAAGYRQHADKQVDA